MSHLADLWRRFLDFITGAALPELPNSPVVEPPVASRDRSLSGKARIRARRAATRPTPEGDPR